MKILWIFLNIGVILAEKLERTYLPPPGYSLAGGSPGNINLPLELPNTKYFSKDEGFSKIPELVIGIDRVSPNQAEDLFEDISTHKPKITGNVNDFNSPNKPTSVFIQSSTFPKEVSTTVPELNYEYNPSYLINDFDKLQEIHNIEKHPSISILNEKNRVYLPSYRDMYNTNEIISITLPSPVTSDTNLNNEYKYMKETDIYKDTSLNPEPIHDISSTLSPNHLSNVNKYITTPEHFSSSVSQFLSTTPIIPIKEKSLILNHVNNQRPDRVQAQSDRQADILNFDQTINPDGYVYSYDTSNGIHGDEEASTTDGVKAKGSYSYIGDDGNFYQVEYTADENGFVPKGAHLPTAPPIPDAILKVIEQAVKDKEAGIYDDGSYNEQKYGYKNLEQKSPQTTNIIGEENFSPENTQNIVRGGLFDEYEISHSENGLQIPVGINNNDLSDIDSLKNYSDYDNENSSLKDLVTNKEEQDPLSNSDLDVSISYQNDEGHLKTSPSYEYFPPRFYGKDQNLPTYTNTDKNNTEKVTAKPFLTPYVTRKDDDSEIKDYDEQLKNKDQNTYFDEQSLADELEENYEDDFNDFNNKQDENKMKFEIKQKNIKNIGNEPNDKHLSINEEIDTREYISGDVPVQKLQYGDKVYSADKLVPSGKEGYFYQNGNKPFVTVKPRVSYATATAATTEFPADINGQDINHTLRPSSFQIPTLSSKTSLIDSSTTLPVNSQATYTIRPGTENSVLTSTHPVNFGKTVSFMPKTTQTARPSYTGFDMQFRPGTESPKHPIYNDQISTKNIIGEDFTGPKQPQRFDPFTGYHY